MIWSEAKERIQAQIIRGMSILKCDGVERRQVTKNCAQKISMRTGVTATKSITCDVLHDLLDLLQEKGRFDCADFKVKFGAKYYKDAPCRYSMTGGVLVEIGVAALVPHHVEGRCYYRLAVKRL